MVERKLKISKSKKYFNEAKKFIPGGVSSPVRAFKSVSGTPLCMVRGKGAYLFDIDGNKYIDYVGSWGPLILGHSHPKVTKALINVTKKGTSFGTSSPYELTLAKLVTKFFPSIEEVRFVNSGSEATAAAIRLARGITGKNIIIKFDGCYHGAVDALLVSPGSGALTLGIADTAGVTQSVARDTISVPYNDIITLKKVIKRYHKNIACVIIEPVAGNMGVIPPDAGFLSQLRKITKEHNIILIFDEVMTGFRVSAGGAQELYGIKPDLTTLGKVIGGGLPVGAVGGPRKLMNHFAPVGNVYPAGTLSGNPLAMTAGIETLKILSKKDFYKKLFDKTQYLFKEIKKSAEKYLNDEVCINQVGAMASIFFTPVKVIDLKTAKTSDVNKFKKFFHYCLNNGVYFPPSQFEACFISSAHSENDIEKTIRVVTSAFKKL